MFKPAWSAGASRKELASGGYSPVVPGFRCLVDGRSGHATQNVAALSTTFVDVVDRDTHRQHSDNLDRYLLAQPCRRGVANNTIQLRQRTYRVRRHSVEFARISKNHTLCGA